MPLNRSTTVLIADDEESICFALARALRRESVVLVIAADGESAVEAFRQAGGDVDAIFLDVRMRGMSGVEAIKRMRQFQPHQSCCLMSAFDLRKLGPQDGVQAILRKPFDLNDFFRILERLIGVSRASKPREIDPLQWKIPA